MITCEMGMEMEHTFGVEAVHHSTDELQLVLQGKVDEIGVDKNAVRWCERCIVCKEQ